MRRCLPGESVTSRYLPRCSQAMISPSIWTAKSEPLAARPPSRKTNSAGAPAGSTCCLTSSRKARSGIAPAWARRETRSTATLIGSMPMFSYGPLIGAPEASEAFRDCDVDVAAHPDRLAVILTGLKRLSVELDGEPVRGLLGVRSYQRRGPDQHDWSTREGVRNRQRLALQRLHQHLRRWQACHLEIEHLPLAADAIAAGTGTSLNGEGSGTGTTPPLIVHFKHISRLCRSQFSS